MRTATLLFAMAAVGCAFENPDHVQDSTGAETGWSCSGGACTTVRATYSAQVPECDGEDTELLVGAGALALLCAVSVDEDGGDVVHETTCRPLVCADELDCPQWGGRTYVCVEEVCQVEDAAGFRLDALDLTALCLFDLPRHASCAEADADPEVQARLARVDEACDADGCDAIPDGCLVP